MNYADIIPFIRLPRSQSTFTYAVPDAMQKEIALGRIVEIEFRKRRIHGCVFRLHDVAPETYIARSIHALLPEPMLTSEYCTFLNHVAETTCTSPAIVYRDAMPSIPKRTRKPILERAGAGQQSLTHTATLEIYEPQRVAARLRDRLQNALKKKIQTLVLFPTRETLNAFLDSSTSPFKRRVAVIHSGLSKGAYWDAWQAAAHGASIVLGTRQAILAPGRWGEIIVVEEEHRAYKQEDQNPRYRTHTLVDFLAHQYGGHVLYFAIAPRVTTVHATAHVGAVSTPVSPSVRILDMRGGRHRAGIVHEETVTAIQTALAKKEHVTILVARGGYAGNVLCRDCGFVLTCPSCSRIYAVRTDTVSDAPTLLTCMLCATTMPMPDACSQCRGAFFDFRGIGVERVQQVLRDIFGAAAGASMTVTTDPEAIDERTVLTVVISCESLLHHPDFRAGERTYQWLLHIVANTHDHGGRVILQSWTPEHCVITAVIRRKPEIFYTAELAERKRALYPPFARSAIAIYKARTSDEARQKTDALSAMLMAMCKKAGILMSEPYIRRGPSRGMLHASLYFRQSLDREEATFIDFLKQIPEPWIIDREPENVF